MRQLIFLLALISIGLNPARADEKVARSAVGVSDQEIRLGTSGSFTGQFAPGGLSIRQGLQAALERANREGGIYGRKLVLTALDDGYEPKKTKENTEELINKRKIFALIGGNGTAGISAALPLIDATRTPLLFPFAVNPELYDGKNRLLFSLTPPMSILTDNMAEYLVVSRKFKKVGAFVIDDKSGTGIISELAPAMKKYNSAISVTRTHGRFETKFHVQIEEFKKAGVDAVVLATNMPQVLEFVPQASARDYRPTFVGIYAATVDLIAQGLKEDVVKPLEFVSTEPLPRIDESLALFQELKADVGTYEPAQSGRVLHGYLAGRIFIEALKKAGRDLTREKLLSTLESFSDFDLSGLTISMSPKKHYAMPVGSLYQLKGGKISKIEVSAGQKNKK